ncbi:hypothetical protein E2562_023820 [Oryza meyeriana var. granulata]|uniref:non-specific serine/threonine protein kinase n=1 Tax=Oryza meyeriana var. granulata TaxID=110450 RepID=A0A6G1D7S7_9ORYZ|nr:hypothetical protein E2562_023820 [Oryza meyeriana var. granulata]
MERHRKKIEVEYWQPQAPPPRRPTVTPAAHRSLPHPPGRSPPSRCHPPDRAPPSRRRPVAPPSRRSFVGRCPTSERSRSGSTVSTATTVSTSGLPPLGAVSLSDIRFVRRLGAGDIGSVYLAEVKGKGSGGSVLVAAKVMARKELAGRNKEGRAHTEREILEAVDHPFLPRLYGVAEGDRWSCLLTEFCPGGDLHILCQHQVLLQGFYY